MIHLTKQQKRDFFLSLLTDNFTEAGVKVGLGVMYNTQNSIRTNSYKLYKSLKPHELDLSDDVVQGVKQAIEKRKISQKVTPNEGIGGEILDPEDSKALVIGGRNKALMLLHKKLDRISANKKSIDDLSLSQLATTVGILFDKAQIMKGEATENIAVMAKIDQNMTPEQSLDMLLKMREQMQVEKHDK
jgi:hypothetical protein